jgi:hypothetical protein
VPGVRTRKAQGLGRGRVADAARHDGCQRQGDREVHRVRGDRDGRRRRVRPRHEPQRKGPPGVRSAPARKRRVAPVDERAERGLGQAQRL